MFFLRYNEKFLLINQIIELFKKIWKYVLFWFVYENMCYFDLFMKIYVILIFLMKVCVIMICLWKYVLFWFFLWKYVLFWFFYENVLFWFFPLRHLTKQRNDIMIFVVLVSLTLPTSLLLLKKAKKKTTLWPLFYGWNSTISRLQSHYQETVYFLQLSPQEILVLIWLILKRRKA